MRITHVIAPAPFGGLEQVVVNLVSGLVEQGIQADLLVLLDRDPTDHPFLRCARDAGLSPSPFLAPGRRYWREVGWMRRQFRRSGAEVVHTHGSRVDVLAGWVARRERIPRVSTVHGFTGGDAKNRLYERLQLRSLKRADRVVAVSDALNSHLRAAGVGRVGGSMKVIPNALRPPSPISREEARRRLGIPADGLAVGWVGRMSYEKGLDLFVQSLEQPQVPASVLAVLIGDGPERIRVEVQVREGGLESRVVWAGALPGAGQLVSAFDILVCSSRSEGTPMVLLEAVSAGIPVVSAAVGGVPDLLGEEGTLVPPNDPHALAEAIGSTCRNLGPARRRAADLRARVAGPEAYRRWVDQYMLLYRDLLESKATP